MAKFRNRAVVVEAVQLLWSTWNEVCALIDAPGGLEAGNPEGCYVDTVGFATEDTNGRIGIKIPVSGPSEWSAIKVPVRLQSLGEKSWLLGVEGDWIVRDRDGKIRPISPTNFERDFERVDDRASADFEPDWSRYPKLADAFVHRPRVNVYWEELRQLLADARADAVQFVHDVRAEELTKAREDERKRVKDDAR
jgi:hypothetical protein